jgi:hypothetical protein
MVLAEQGPITNLTGAGYPVENGWHCVALFVLRFYLVSMLTWIITGPELEGLRLVHARPPVHRWGLMMTLRLARMIVTVHLHHWEARSGLWAKDQRMWSWCLIIGY